MEFLMIVNRGPHEWVPCQILGEVPSFEPRACLVLAIMSFRIDMNLLRIGKVRCCRVKTALHMAFIDCSDAAC